ncbi:MAG: hypothetical protein LAO24_00840 [Acidobacteriia bacterium]|nr:hypothetical protein [Terriglobia bacterium]
MTRAAERGFNVSRPWGDTARYDVSIEREARFLRVQVKSASHWIRSAYVSLARLRSPLVQGRRTGLFRDLRSPCGGLVHLSSQASSWPQCCFAHSRSQGVQI